VTIPYDPALVEQVSYNLDLREPNQAALDAIAADHAAVSTVA